MSTILKVDANGAVLLPVDLCRAAGVAPGAELVADVQTGRIVLEPARLSSAERIVARAHALPPDVLERLPADGASQHDHYIYGTPKRPLRPIWEEIIALTADIPPEELDKPPIDGAAQLDHYLYGAPKLPE
jgi:bifunctional DNA-binding transcriptional regulator/antitoxin component of YhaV-PrlF toxin-antitoxin module